MTRRLLLLAVLAILAMCVFDVAHTWRRGNRNRNGNDDDDNKSDDDDNKSEDDKSDDDDDDKSDDDDDKSDDDDNKSDDDDNKSDDDDNKSDDDDDKSDDDDDNKSDDDDSKSDDDDSKSDDDDGSNPVDVDDLSEVRTGQIGIITNPANDEEEDDSREDSETACFSCEKFLKNLEDLISETEKGLSESECDVPEGCLELPGPVSQGAVLTGTTGRAGYAIVNHYECSREGDINYKYVSGNKESLCDNDGERALPALICIPTNCYLRVINPLGQSKPWYAGNVSVTESGLSCQKWSSNYPHRHPVSHLYPALYPGDQSVEGAGNMCRGVGLGARPWCYTTDPYKRWEFCDVSACDDDRKCGIPPDVPGAQPMKTELLDNEVHVYYACLQGLTARAGTEVATCNMADGTWDWPDLLCSSSECFYFDDEIRGTAVYHGDVNTTLNGRDCQAWGSQSPHTHTVNDELSELPGETSLAEVGNKCRGGNSESAPWCYTIDPRVKLEYCSVPYCTFS